MISLKKVFKPETKTEAGQTVEASIAFFKKEVSKQEKIRNELMGSLRDNLELLRSPLPLFETKEGT